MKSIRTISPVVRAVGIIGAVAILVTAVTYAALQSQATLTGTTVASATAALEVDNLNDTGGTEPGLSTDEGFTFTGIVPGTPGTSNTETFTLTNAGDVGLDVTVAVPALPVWDVTVDNSKVYVNFVCTGGFAATVSHSLADLEDGTVEEALGGPLATAGVTSCDVTVDMDADAFTASGTTTTTGFDLLFTGTGV